MKTRLTKLNRFLVLTLMIGALAIGLGCASSGNDDDDETQVSTTAAEPIISTVQLEIGIPVNVDVGDQLVPANSDTRIRVSHALNSSKQVTLLAGSADLIKGKFQLM